MANDKNAPAAPPAPAKPVLTPEQEAAAEARAQVKAERDKRAAYETGVRSATKRAYDVFRGPDVGLPDGGAALLAAYVLLTAKSEDEAKALGRTELIAVANRFQRFHPAAWVLIRRQEASQFVAALERYGIVLVDPKTLRGVASVIRK